MNELNGYDIEDLDAGMSATFAKTITEEGVGIIESAARLEGRNLTMILAPKS